jgi:hypothetical protein
MALGSSTQFANRQHAYAGILAGNVLVPVARVNGFVPGKTELQCLPRLALRKAYRPAAYIVCDSNEISGFDEG